MMMNLMRKQLKLIIWLVVISFSASVFLMAAGSWFYSPPAGAERSDDPRDPARNPEAEKAPEGLLDTKASASVATITLDNKSAMVTEGQLNRLFNQAAAAQPGLKPEQFRMFAGGQFLEHLVEDRLVGLIAETSGVDVTKELEAAKKDFTDSPKERRDAFLRNMGLTEDQFLDMRKDQITREKMQQRVTQGKEVPEQAIKDHYEAHKAEYKTDKGEQRTFAEVRTQIENTLRAQITDADVQAYYGEHKARWQLPDQVAATRLLIDPAAAKYADKLAVKDEDLVKYHEANKSKFLGQPRVKIQHLLIDPKHDSIKKEVQVSDADLKDFYEKNKEEYKKADEVHAQRILVKVATDAGGKEKAETEIKALHEQVKAGGDFAEIAKKSSQEANAAQTGGDLSWLEKETLSPEFDEAVFKLGAGQVTEPFLDEDGWQIVKVVEKREARQLPFEEASAQVREKLTKKKADELAKKRASDLAAKGAKTPAGFEELVKQNSHAPSASKGGDLGALVLGPNPGNAMVGEIGTMEYMDHRFQSVVSQMASGAVTGPVETSHGFHVVKVVEKLAPEPQPFESVKNEVRQAVEAEKKQALLSDLEAQIQAALQAGEAFIDVARRFSDSTVDPVWEKVSLDPQATSSLKPEQMAEMGPTTTLPEVLVNTLSSLEDGQISKPVDHFGKIFMLHRKVTLPAQYKALDDEITKEIRFALNPTVDDDAVKAYYEENKEQFTPKEETTVEWITFTEKYLADRIVQKLKDGDKKAFDEHGEKQKFSGPIKNKELAKLVADLGPGEYSKEPVETKSFGWILAHVVSGGGAVAPEFDKVKMQIRARMVEEKKEELFNSWLSEMKRRARIEKQSLPSIIPMG